MSSIKVGRIERAEIRLRSSASAMGQHFPGADECEAILADWWVDVRVIRHSRKVAKVASKLAAELLRSGLGVNPELVEAAALLHDIAKGQPDHAAAGASMVRGMGFDQVAEIVAAHTDLGAFRALDEAAIVYLADKLVRNEQLVTLEERFKPALIRFRKDASALQSVHNRLAAAKAVAGAVEKRLGIPLVQLLRADPEVDGVDRLSITLQSQEMETA